MNSFTRTIFDFVTENDERLQTACDIHDSWEDIVTELIKEFQEKIRDQVKELIIENFPNMVDLKVDISLENNITMIYKESWKHADAVLFCVALEDINSNDYYCIRWNNDPKIISEENQSKIEAYWRNSQLSTDSLAKNWLTWKYTGFDYGKINSLKLILKDKRQQMVDDYSRILVDDYFRKYYEHIDALVSIVTQKQ